MEVTKVIGQRRSDRQEERNCSRRTTGCGLEAEVTAAGIDVPVLQ